MNKKFFLFAISLLIFTVAISSIDAALCKGFDGYYHDCGYSYGHNSYSSQNYRGYNKNIFYIDSSYKKYNPINSFYIVKGPGYDRPRYDAEIRYKDYGHKNVRYIKDARTYEYRNNYYDPNARHLKVYIDNSYDKKLHCPNGYICA